MSFGFSVGDIITVSTLAHDIWKNFNDSPDQFKAIQTEVASFHLILQDVARTMPGCKLNQKQGQDLASLVQGCRDVLTELNTILKKHGILATSSRSFRIKSQRAWNKLRWDQDEVRELRRRITLNTSLLNTFNISHLTQVSSALKDDIAEVDKRLEVMQLYQNNCQLQEIADWLSPLNFFATQNDVYARQQEGTCQWLLQSPIFKDWSLKGKKTLWCPGIPGAGKTVFASIVVDHLQKTFHNDKVAIAWVYCNYKEKSQQTLGNLMGSLLKQLVQRHSNVPSRVIDLYEKYRNQDTRPKLEDVAHVLKAVIGSYLKAFIVVDALDECTEDFGIRADLLKQLRSLPGNANLMITSRYLSAIERELKGEMRLDVYAIGEDVARYVNGRIPQEYRLLRHVEADPTLRDDIVNTIVSNVKGMFLLAQLHIDSIVSKHNRKAIRDTLRRLPKGLDNTYAVAMSRIEGQNQDDRELAEKVLSWISYACRPLSITELQYAVAVENGDTEIDIDALPDEEILISICAGMVVIDLESNAVRLVHYTTQDYFERIRSQRFSNAQLEITSTCLTYLSFDVFAEGLCLNEKALEDRMQQNRLLDYAAQYWGDHARGEAEEGIARVALEFLMDDSKVSAATQVLLSRDHRYSVYSEESFLGFSGIHLAASFGLTKIMDLLLEKGFQPDTRTKEDRSPLSWAAENGHKAMVELLLDKGVYPNSKDLTYGQTPLSWAAENGHSAVAELLLERGAEVDLTNHDGWTPLQRAARRGHEAMARLLVEKGSEIEAKNNRGEKALHQAAIYGYEGMVRELLEMGANVESGGWTPLHEAARFFGNEGTITELLKGGANIKAKTGEGMTVLHLAGAERGNEAIVKLLLDHGAEIEAQDNSGWTVLQSAVRKRQEAVVQLLLEKGSNVEAKNNIGETALHQATIYGLDKIALLLLRMGANANARTNDGWTPLHEAANFFGNVDTVKLLLDNGADILARTPDGQSALHLAAKKNRDAIVKLLLEKEGSLVGG